MSKVLKKRAHWSAKVREVVASRCRDGSLGFAVCGGADAGQFPHLGEAVDHERVVYHHAARLQGGHLLLEVNGTPVAGLTRRDALAVIANCKDPLRLKTVKPGSLINKDLRHYLNQRFAKGSLDHEFQQTIRDNLYLRTTPCTTRAPREGEVPGVDYNFILLAEFLALEKSGTLLETGTYEGNFYGTPKPPSEPPAGSLPLPEPRPGLGSRRKRTKSVSNMEHREGSHAGRAAALNGGRDSGDSSDGDGAPATRTQTTQASQRRGASGERPPKLHEHPLGSASLGGPSSEGSNGLEVGGGHGEELGPLPANWEMACTESGEIYFIDHSTRTTSWLDPRRVQKQKPLELCNDDELPYGWERIDDPQHGVYYVDHLNKRTQFENPVVEAKRRRQSQRADVSSSTLPRSKPGGGSPHPQRSHSANDLLVTTSSHDPHPPEQGAWVFTRDPRELRGSSVRASLLKTSQGFGFTIVGGDTPREFLQVRGLVPDGPATRDGRMRRGDVIVYVNDTCVLGFTQKEVVRMFQSVPVGDSVDLQLCRGYPLPYDPDDPDLEVPPYQDGRPSDRGGPGSSKSMPDIADSSHAQSPPTYDPHRRPFSPPTYIAKANGYYDDSGSQTSSVGSQPELVSVKIVKGRAGFGFTIADSPSGQRIKQILDSRRGLELREGDLILEINGRSVRECSHMDVVTLLKECATGAQASMLLQRGGQSPFSPNRVAQMAYERHDSQGSLTRDSPPRRFSQPPALPPAGIAPSHAQPPYRRPPAEEFRGRQEASRVYEDPQSLYEDSQRNSYQEITIHLRRQEAGFGFRILGGEELGQPIRIGAIVPGGSADLDGRMRSGDELVSVDGIPVSGKSHRSVIGLMQQAARNGLVALTIHRPTLSAGAQGDGRGGDGVQRGPPWREQASYPEASAGRPSPEHYPGPATRRAFTPPPGADDASGGHAQPYDVVIQRQENEGFGFIIISSVSRPDGGASIGHIIEGSPAERGRRLKVGDRVVALNGRSIVGMPHADIVTFIRDSGLRITLSVLPAQDANVSPSLSGSSKPNLASTSPALLLANRSETRPRQDTRLPSITSTSDGEYFVAELERGNTGFGFSIRGGKEYSMDLFILRVAEEGPAIRQSRMRVGDQIMEINGESTRDMMHARAIELIKSGGRRARLLLKRGTGQVPDCDASEGAPRTWDRDLCLLPSSPFDRRDRLGQGMTTESRGGRAGSVRAQPSTPCAPPGELASRRRRRADSLPRASTGPPGPWRVPALSRVAVVK
ncbi:membrane-associated guanylate kinase, WW and PDZ domain-containing protein 2-like isoform X2 [Lampetra planeri]